MKKEKCSVVCVIRVNELSEIFACHAKFMRIGDRPKACVIRISERVYKCYLYDEKYKEDVNRYLRALVISNAKIFADPIVWKENYNPNYDCYQLMAA